MVTFVQIRREDDGAGCAEPLERRLLLDAAPLPPLDALLDPDNPVVRIETPLGDIDLELFPDAAPGAVFAFLDGLSRYPLTAFTRLVPGEILQAGRPMDPQFYQTAGQFQETPVADVPMLPNAARTVAAVNFGPTGGAITPEFFFNLTDNPELDTGPGATIVFGRVVDDRSWAVVQGIAGLNTADLDEQFLPPALFGPLVGPIEGPFNSVPVRAGFDPAAPLANPDAFVVISDAQLLKATGDDLFFSERIYYPEGFIGGENISEFVPIANFNDEPASVRVILRRERTPAPGDVRDLVVFTEVIPPNSRSGVTLTDAIRNFPGGTTFADEPYAIEIRSTRPVAATLSHFDFGTATGESFTDETSTTWSFAETEVDDDLFSFLVWQNTTGLPATVTVTFFTALGETSTRTVVTPAHQRGGLNIGELGLPEDQRLGIVVTSDQPIVAALSRFDVSDGEELGLTELGVTGDGVTSGVAPLGTLGDNGDDSGFSERISFLNRSDQEGTVTIRAAPIGSTGTTVTRALPLPGNGLASLDFDDIRDELGAENFAITFTSNRPVIAGGVHVERGDAASTRYASAAGTNWLSAEGFMDPSRAGEDLFESLAVFNPGASDATATVTFRFTDGTSITQLLALPAGQSVLLELHNFEPLLVQAAAGRNFYSVQVTSENPVVMQFRHYDLTLGGDNAAGGFGTLGQPFGELTPIIFAVPA